MVTVVICEKPSQARKIRSVIGERFGKVVAARGHLLRLELPEEVRPEWKAWGDDLLMPPPEHNGGRYGFLPAAGFESELREIEAALRDADEAIIATDTDREGQVIGGSLLTYFGFRGRVKRAWWKTEDEKAFANAFEALADNATYGPLYESGLLRREADQIMGLTLTRIASRKFVPGGGMAIGLGRVMTPTLGIVCRRELEIRNFVAREFFEIAATFSGGGHDVTLWHRPRSQEQRIFGKQRAAAIAAAAQAFSGAIKVTASAKRTAPPKLPDLAAVQKMAGKWGWAADRTLTVMQSLYETHTLITYPRSGSRYLPENIIGEAGDLITGLGLVDVFAALVPQEPVIRKGAVYSDAKLKGEPHHAIIPNVNMAAEFAARHGVLGADEKRLFEAIARSFLAALSPDEEFDETVMQIEVAAADTAANPAAVIPFVVKGRVVRKPGWRAVYLEKDDEDEDEDEEEETKTGELPAIADGTGGTVTQTESVRKTTSPPERYTEGELPSVMAEAWKFVADGAERERLKETNGIGTPATRGNIVGQLKHHRLLEPQRSKIVPSAIGLWVFGILAEAVPELVDPAATARMEAGLDAVMRGEAEAVDVLARLTDQTRRFADALLKAEATTAMPKILRPPTSGMVDAAKAKAKRENIAPPAGVLVDFDTCREFLGPRRDAAEGLAGPSEKQVEMAHKLAGSEGIPDDVLGDRKKLSAFIGERVAQRAAAPASVKQIEWVGKFVKDGTKPPKGWPDRVTAADAKSFLDKVFARSKKSRV